MEIQGVLNCTLTDISRQIELLFAGGTMSDFAGLSLTDLKGATSLAWDAEVKPLKRSEPLTFEGTKQQVNNRF